MSDDLGARIDRLSREAEALPDGPSKVGLIEEAIRLADSHNDTRAGFSLRKQLLRASTFGGSPEKSLVAFTWCVACCDREPERFNIRGLLWEYKWVVSSLRYFPQIGRDQIENAMTDMTRRYEQAGMGLRPVYKLRCRFAMHRKDHDDVQRFQRLWRTAPAGWGSDCPACEQDDQVDYLIYVGKDERAVEHAKPIVHGRMTCAEVPHVTFARLLLPLLRLGRTEEAASFHNRGYRLIAEMHDLLEETGDHLNFLSLTGNFDRAVVLLERHLPWALDTVALSRRFGFFQAARLLLLSAADAGRQTLALRLPRAFAGYRDDGNYPVNELQTKFEDECRHLAEQFDRRNQTDAFARKVAELPTWLRWRTDYPLKRRAADEE